MRNRFSIFFVTLIILCGFISASPLFISPITQINENPIVLNNLKTSALVEVNDTIIINDYPGSLTNWTWANDQGYCTGSGTLVDPYIISDIFFNTSSITDNCLSIRNSRKHFRITNCEFKGYYTFAGIQLFNTTNSVISENFMYPYTGALVWVFNSSYNLIQNNNASAGYYYGFLIDGSSGVAKMNTVSDNLVNFNLDSGIEFRSVGCELNTFSNNIVYNNTYGLKFGSFSHNNSISGNHIGNNTFGIHLNVNSEYQKIYGNCFFTNVLHANDDGNNNTWDNGVKGNFWDNYTGLDANSDGIGDIPYNITGSAASQDRFPLMNCPSPSAPSLIPGYNLFTILVICMISIIAIVLPINKRKFKS